MQNKEKIKREEGKANQIKMDIEKARKEKESDYSMCLLTASLDSHNWWKRSCKSLGLDEDCRLPSNEADTINESRQKDEDRCLQIYKSN